MEVHLHRPLAADKQAALIERLSDIDPAALIDTDPQTGHLRLNTLVTHSELLALLVALDPELSAADLHLIPSVCCGGCSG